MTAQPIRVLYLVSVQGRLTDLQARLAGVAEVAAVMDPSGVPADLDQYDVVLWDWCCECMHPSDVFVTMPEGIPLIAVVPPDLELAFLQRLDARDYDYVLSCEPQIVRLPLLVRRAADHARLRVQAQFNEQQIQRLTSDLNNYQQIEAELRERSEELARSSKFKDEFLAMMSHELRTPLTAILGRADLLLEQVYGQLPAHQLEMVRKIHHSGRQLLGLINDILEYSKIEAGRTQLQISPCSVAGLCETIAYEIASEAEVKQIELRMQIDPEVETILVDERRLKEILTKLLTNALKFTPQYGSVGLRVLADPNLDTVRFIVSDTGIGISWEDQQRLFQPFVQIDSSLNRAFPGTGLGLAIVDRLVRMHNGVIQLESMVDVGSRFTIVLPRGGPETSDA
jgi:signal transduction histidine kinase